MTEPKTTPGPQPQAATAAPAARSLDDGAAVAAALAAAGVTHVVLVPDSALGRWDAALASTPGLTLVRACREGEAVGLAAGLHLGGARPVVMMQCTGMFEAGDAIRNVVHDLRLPIFFLIGVRSWYAYREGRTADTCPVFTEPVLRAWQIPYTFLDPRRDAAADLAAAWSAARSSGRAAAVLLAE